MMFTPARGACKTLAEQICCRTIMTQWQKTENAWPVMNLITFLPVLQLRKAEQGFVNVWTSLFSGSVLCICDVEIVASSFWVPCCLC